MKNIPLITCFLLLGTALSAQNPIDEVLIRVEQASLGMDAQRKLTEAQKLDARTGNYLANPTVSYETLWGSGDNGGNLGELTVAQAFDFPSAYANRRKIAGLKGQLYDLEGASFRVQLLLEAKMLCLEIIALRQQEALLGERHSNARELSEAYQRKLEVGSANIVEINKVKLEELNSRTALSLNASALKGKLQQLSNLVGGEAVDFDCALYPPEAPLLPLAELQERYLEENPEIRGLENQQEIDRRSVALSRSLSLPQFEVGYRQNFGVEGKAKGFLAGISVPLFEHKNTVKAAKARTVFSETRLHGAKLSLQTQLSQLYEQAQTLRLSADQLRTLLEGQNNLSLLKKALDGGQITLIEYFTEAGLLFESRSQLLDIERDYRLCTAQLYRYEL